MNGYFFQGGIEFLHFHPFRGILLVFGRDVPADAWFTTGPVLGALQDHLNPIAFLCHLSEFKGYTQPDIRLLLDLFSGCPQLLYHTQQSVLVDGTDGFGRNLQRNPLVFFGKEKALFLQIRQKPAIGLDIRMRNGITGNRSLPCNLTYSRHTVVI